MASPRVITCAKCERDRPSKARGMCASCYQGVLMNNRESLMDYPTDRVDPSMEVDEVAVDRAVEWITYMASLPQAARGSARYAGRLTLGEQIEVARRTYGRVPYEVVRRHLPARSVAVKTAWKEVSRG